MWKGPLLVGAQVNLHGRKKKIRKKRSQAFSDVKIYCIALLDIWSIAVWLSNLFISFCLVQIYSVGVKGEQLVDVEANGDVFTFAFNVSHLTGGENLNCDITVKL